LQDFGIQHAETLQSLQIKINKNRQEKRGFIQFLTGDFSALNTLQKPRRDAGATRKLPANYVGWIRSATW